MYRVATQTRYNAAAQPLTSVQKQLISQLSALIESKSVFVSERGLTSTQWTEYSGGTKRVQYSTVPTSSITAETVTVDGMVLTHTDGRGNNGEYDSMGRRAIKRVMVNGNVTLHQRYIYRGYLQIACIDLTRSHHPALWYITWDPTQPIATRPLAIQKDGTWYTYGWDLTKNICEVYRTSGTLGTSYTYTPYGQVSAEGATEQPIQWSSEFNDTELGLIYYNYRHYNPVDGRWTGRDRIKVQNEYIYVDNISLNSTDILGEQRISQLMKTCTRISEERKTAIRNSKHFRGCDINIACEYTRNAVSYANVSGYNITLYIPRCMSDGEIGLLNTLNHELIHLYDNCKLGGIRDCRSFWYGEIRASYFGQCAQIVAESKRKACAIRGAKRSVSYIVKKKLKDKAKDAAFWQPCYPNDKVADKFAENAYIQMKRLPNNPFATL